MSEIEDDEKEFFKFTDKKRSKMKIIKFISGCFNLSELSPPIKKDAKEMFEKVIKKWKDLKSNYVFGLDPYQSSGTENGILFCHYFSRPEPKEEKAVVYPKGIKKYSESVFEIATFDNFPYDKWVEYCIKRGMHITEVENTKGEVFKVGKYKTLTIMGKDYNDCYVTGFCVASPYLLCQFDCVESGASSTANIEYITKHTFNSFLQ